MLVLLDPGQAGESLGNDGDLIVVAPASQIENLNLTVRIGLQQSFFQNLGGHRSNLAEAAGNVETWHPFDQMRKIA